MMRILILTTDITSKGGIQRYTQYQIRAVRSCGYDLCVLTMADVSLFPKITYALKAMAWSKKKKIDLIICNHVALSPIALCIKKMLGVPYLVNVYGLEIWTGINRLKLAGLQHADGIIGDCNFILNYIEINLGVSKEKMFLLYDCVDMELFRPREKNQEIYKEYNLPKNKVLLITVGRLVYNKGQETVINLLKNISGKAVYVAIGGGPKMHEWQKLAEANGVADRVFFTGEVPEERLLSLYALADISLYVSRFLPHEGGGLPLALIESSAFAIPVIGSDQDGTQEAVVDRENGFLVSPQATDEITNKINYLIEHPEERTRMGENGRIICRERFSYEIFYARQKEILASMLQRTSNGEQYKQVIAQIE